MEQDKLFLRTVADMLNQCQKRPTCKFTAFLDEHQCALAQGFLKNHSGGCDWRFFGGHPDCTRAVLAVSSTGTALVDEAFPIQGLCYRFRPQDTLSHRDFLGCLMAQKIDRSLVGDIFVTEGMACAFVHKNAQEIALSLDKIGRTGVRAEPGVLPALVQRRTEDFTAIITSCRLDCVLAGAIGLSRSGASTLIQSGGVMVDYIEVVAPAKEVRPGSVLSVRGKGKFVFVNTGGNTKKGRLIAQFERYL